MQMHIVPSKASGSFYLPTSKSQTYRAMIFAAFAKGASKIYHYLDSPDTDHLICCLSQLGASIVKKKDHLIIHGTNGIVHQPRDILYVGNSGILFRFLTAIVALIDNYVIINGDESIQTNRPIKPLTTALNALGAFTYSTQNAPLIIKGPLKGKETIVLGEDSQFVSALLIALSFKSTPTLIKVQSPGELPWVDLTIHWLDKLNIRYSRKGYHEYTLYGSSSYGGFEYSVPSDLSTAAYPIIHSIISRSPVTLYNIDTLDPQGDKTIFPLLQSIGANIKIDHEKKTVCVDQTTPIEGGEIDINQSIDAITIFAVLGCFVKDKLIINNGLVARTKECDRIKAITTELKKMGAIIEEKKDGMVIYPSPLVGANVNSYNDHRMVFSLAIAALSASCPTIINNAKCIEKTYPSFVEDFSKQGALLSWQ